MRRGTIAGFLPLGITLALVGCTALATIAAPAAARDASSRRAGEESHQFCEGHIENDTRDRAKVVKAELGPGDEFHTPNPRGREIEPKRRLEFIVSDERPTCRVELRVHMFDRDDELIGAVDLRMTFDRERGSASCEWTGRSVVCESRHVERDRRHLLAFYKLRETRPDGPG